MTKSSTFQGISCQRAYFEARKDAKRLNKPMPEFESFLFAFLKEEKIDE